MFAFISIFSSIFSLAQLLERPWIQNIQMTSNFTAIVQLFCGSFQLNSQRLIIGCERHVCFKAFMSHVSYLAHPLILSLSVFRYLFLLIPLYLSYSLSSSLPLCLSFSTHPSLPLLFFLVLNSSLSLYPFLSLRSLPVSLSPIYLSIYPSTLVLNLRKVRHAS